MCASLISDPSRTCKSCECEIMVPFQNLRHEPSENCWGGVPLCIRLNLTGVFLRQKPQFNEGSETCFKARNGGQKPCIYESDIGVAIGIQTEAKTVLPRSFFGAIAQGHPSAPSCAGRVKLMQLNVCSINTS